MKTIIYYFTSTGNSLAAAKKIAAALGDCEIAPIAAFRNATKTIVPTAERVGIICPVYFSGLPAMVASFAVRLNLASANYVFSVVTHGGGGGSAALRQLAGILKNKGARGLDAGFEVKMPGNYILMYESPAGEERQRLLASADSDLEMIAGRVLVEERSNLPYALSARLLRAVAYPWFLSHVHGGDRKFTVTDRCRSCGTCAAVCPAGNIELVDGKPAWKHRCERCCGCIHLCPTEAIQAGSGTVERQRYRNPSIDPAELKLQR